MTKPASHSKANRRLHKRIQRSKRSQFAIKMESEHMNKPVDMFDREIKVGHYCLLPTNNGEMMFCHVDDIWVDTLSLELRQADKITGEIDRGSNLFTSFNHAKNNLAILKFVSPEEQKKSKLEKQDALDKISMAARDKNSIRLMIKTDRKIEATKFIHNETGMSLRESLNVIKNTREYMGH